MKENREYKRNLGGFGFARFADYVSDLMMLD
jgi:hypothetical protein